MTIRAGVIALGALGLAAILPGGPMASAPVVWDHPPRPGPGTAGGEARPPAVRDGEMAEGILQAEGGSFSLSASLRELLPAASELSPPPLIWSSTLDDSGVLFVGTGNTGSVVQLDRKGTASVLFDSGEFGVRALASGASGDLFAATFPGGGIYHIKSNGEAEAWFDPQDRYVWAIAVDRADRLYVATGERGIIYQVRGRDDGSILLDTDQSHVTALATDRAGNLYAGTDPDGLVYRINDEGTQVVLDADLREISALAVTPEGVLYAAAISEEVVQSARKPGEKSDLTIEVTPAPEGSVLEEQAELPRKITIDLADLLPPSAAPVEGSAGRIYRVEPGSPPALVWRSDQERVYSLAHTGGHGTLFGTGGGSGGGRLYRIEPDGSITTLHRLRESHVTSISPAPDGRAYVCTSNPGRVYVLDAKPMDAGTYLSPVRDAGRPARWGTISWEADIPPGTRIELSTRSGNSPSPDASWGGWSAPYTALASSAIESAPARYLQWKADLSRLRTEATPRLNRVTITLLPQNLGPELRFVSALEPGSPHARPAEPSQGATTGPPAPKVEPPKGTRWITWSSGDPDGDALAHSIWIRKAGETALRKLADGLAAPPFALDDASLPEGIHELKIEVTDSTANGPERALADKATTTFLVDHTPPILEVRPTATPPAPGRVAVHAAARDSVGTIARAEYSLDPARPEPTWTPVPCRDGICDSSVEAFLVELEGPVARRITLRVFDAAANSATLEATASGKEGK